ncbi:hypothetical protein FHX15_001906 [Rhizobium sp. BK650]|uniref:hypothetical protein n=1 Tax=Rhizobium sp. BK650 TaxID=2586990 RepID=UPI0016108E42|nr:hypothetical protein [Rhizobium sp. BK650]MBB3656678.1 hypothetical protein [Rhizobium sp. BK650]
MADTADIIPGNNRSGFVVAGKIEVKLPQFPSARSCRTILYVFILLGFRQPGLMFSLKAGEGIIKGNTLGRVTLQFCIAARNFLTQPAFASFFLIFQQPQASPDLSLP